MAVSVVTNALTSVANVKYWMGIKQTDTTDDDRIATLINLISNRIESWCGRKFKQVVYTDELYDGNGKTKLLLKEYPIADVSIKEDDATVDADSYYVYEAEGYIYNEYVFSTGHRNFKVTYKGGYATIPAGLESICIEWINIIMEGRMKDAATDQKDMKIQPPDRLAQALEAYKRRDF